MKKIITIILSLTSIAFSQTAPGIQWQNTISGSAYDDVHSIKQTNDGGYIVGGYSQSNISGDKTENNLGFNDIWIVKLDSIGNILWQNTIGGGGDDLLCDILPTTDGGYIIGSYSNSNISVDKTENNLGGTDYWIVKLNSSGNIVWQNTIGGNQNDDLTSLISTSDGGYLLGGFSLSGISGDKNENSNGGTDYWIVKINSTGNVVWQNTIGGSNTDEASVVIETSDGNYLVGGSSGSNISGDKTENTNGGLDYWIIKLNSTGGIIWQNTIGGNNPDAFKSLVETVDNGYLIGGYSNSSISGDKNENSSSFDYWTLKLDANGNILWQNTIGGTMDDYLWTIMRGDANTYILCGGSSSNISGDKTENSRGSTDYWILKINDSGNIIWDKTMGGNNNDFVLTSNKNSDGSYIIGGYSLSSISGEKTENSLGYDMWIVKLAVECFSPTLASVVPNNNSICSGDSVQLMITGDLQSAGYWSIYSGSCGGTLVDTTSQNSIWITPSGTTDYFVRGEGGCVTPGTCQSLSITVNNLPNVYAGSDSTICMGDTIEILGTNTNTYSWDNGIGSVNPASVSPSGTTTYIVTGTDLNGCVNKDTVIINVNGLPIIDAGLDTTICFGASTTLNASGANIYSWNQGIGALNPALVSPTDSLQYIVTGTDINGCINTDSVVVNVNLLPTVFAGNDTLICEGSDIVLNASGANTYEWIEVALGNPVAIDPLFFDSTFVVEGTDLNGCSNIDSIEVSVSILPGISFNIPEDSICISGNSINLSASPLGGVFSGPGVTATSFDPGSAGTGLQTITYTFTNGDGCSTDFSDVIYVSSCLGVEEYENMSLIMYPNPAEDFITVRSNNKIDYLEIMDISGKVVYSAITNHLEVTANIENLSPGIYMLKALIDFKQYTLKLIKQ